MGEVIRRGWVVVEFGRGPERVVGRYRLLRSARRDSDRRNTGFTDRPAGAVYTVRWQWGSAGRRAGQARQQKMVDRDLARLDPDEVRAHLAGATPRPDAPVDDIDEVRRRLAAFEPEGGEDDV